MRGHRVSLREEKRETALFHYNSGNAMSAEGRFEAAILQYEKALSFAPEFVEGLLQSRLRPPPAWTGGKGRFALPKSGEPKAGFFLRPTTISATHTCSRGCRMRLPPVYRKSLTLKPDNHQSLSNMGNILQKQGRFAEAVSFYERAVGIVSRQPGGLQ